MSTRLPPRPLLRSCPGEIVLACGCRGSDGQKHALHNWEKRITSLQATVEWLWTATSVPYRRGDLELDVITKPELLRMILRSWRHSAYMFTNDHFLLFDSRGTRELRAQIPLSVGLIWRWWKSALASRRWPASITDGRNSVTVTMYEKEEVMNTPTGVGEREGQRL